MDNPLYVTNLSGETGNVNSINNVVSGLFVKNSKLNEDIFNECKYDNLEVNLV